MLRDPSSPLSAVYVPGAGMIATSLSDGGIELLGQRRGLDAYLPAGKTMGIPLLYPWANRLSAKTYDVDGETVTLTPDAYGVRPDNNGLPIHGGWRPTPDGEHSRSLTRSSPPNWISELRTNCMRVSRSRIWWS
jgi:galactose mutarotase-like enzyme